MINNTTSSLEQFYSDRGNTIGTPIIFIHGFPFDHSQWDKQVAALPDRYRPIAYDIRGHGQSEAGDGHYSLEFFVDDLFELIDSLGLEKPVICGLSMGGYIALRALERRPWLAKGLILCDTRSEADSNEAKIKRAAVMKTITEEGLEKYAEDSIKNLFWTGSIQSGLPEVQRIKTIIEKTNKSALCGTLMALAARTDTTEALESIAIPALIIVGEHDAITPPIAAESLHERISGSELVVIKNAGHLSNLENPEDFNQAMLDFLEKMQ